MKGYEICLLKNYRGKAPIIRYQKETWREVVSRYASRLRKEKEALFVFDRLVKMGMEEEWSALEALFDCEVLVPDPVRELAF